MSNDAYPVVPVPDETLVPGEEGVGHWRHWGTERIAIAEYAHDGVTAVVTCVEGNVSNWMVSAGSARFAEGITRGANAFAEAIALVEASSRRYRALGESDREWYPLLFRAIAQDSGDEPAAR